MNGSGKIRAAALSPPIADEADFVRRVQAFQEDAWDELYNVYFPKMYRYLYVHVGNRDVAEELAAEVFAQACRGIRRYHYRGVPLSAWLYRVAHNVMVDWMRRQRRNTEVPLLDDILGNEDTERIESI